MINRLSLVALAVLSTSAAYADTKTVDVKSVVGYSALTTTQEASNVFAQQQDNGIYIVTLSHKSALHLSYASLGDDRKSVVKEINAQQNDIIAQIKLLDANAIILNRVRLVDNSLHVQMSTEAAAALQGNEQITGVILTTQDADNTAQNAYKPYPFLEVKDAGDSITVAIIGNGVDYTHTSLGGSGLRADYEQAIKNRSNAWDGFPTDTVIGGMDFSGSLEGYHIDDYNPIENELDPNLQLGFYPSGTAQAALILEQAPDAKILAYKTLDWMWAYVYPALDFIVDPNQDGDMSDRPDIVLINAFGAGGFYEEKGHGISHPTLQINHLRRLSGIGSLVVVPAGTHNYNSMFNTSSMSAAPEALTVGSVGIDSDTDLATLSPFTPAGPVRGSGDMKPEVVANGEDMIVALVGTGSASGYHGDTTAYAAAQTAGVAAKAWAANRHLSALEIKALVANTANAQNVVGRVGDIEDGSYIFDGTKYAETPFMGSGLVDGSAAENALSVMWETGNYQPNLSFGFVETKTTTSVTKRVTIKNLSDSVQTYSTSNTTYGNKISNAGVSFTIPHTISIPANQSVEFAVTMTLDASKLENAPIVTADDFTMVNWNKTNVNGAISFTNTNVDSNDSVLTMPWQVFPKTNIPFYQENLKSISGLPFEDADYTAKVQASGWWISGQSVDITNESNGDVTYVAMPMMMSRAIPDLRQVGQQGHHVKETGATLVNNGSCASGKALTVAIKMFETADLPMAEHFDKSGSAYAWFTIYNESITNDYASDPFGLDQNATDAQKIAYFEVVMDPQGKPQTRFIDYSKAYEWWNPSGRKTVTSIPTIVSPGGDTVIVSECVDNIFHDDFQTIEQLDESLGWIFATDRDAQSPVGQEMIRYNPVVNGSYGEEVVDHTGQTGFPNWWDTWTPCAPKSWNENYCLEIATKHLASNTAMALIGDVTTDENGDELPLAWSKILTIPAGQTARAYATVTTQCDPSVISSGSWIVDKNCYPGVMFIKTGTNETGYLIYNGTTDATPVHNQSFSVYENTENGAVIGQISLDSDAFFIDTDYRRGEMFILNALVGQPFSVSIDGEITVINSDALDYEAQTSYTLKVQVDHVNRASEVVEVTIDVTNTNDLAPVQVNAIATINAQAGEEVVGSVANSFVDVEGDGVTYLSDNLPDGVTMSHAGVFSGVATQGGDYEVIVTATDGMNSTNFIVMFSIADAPVIEAAPVVEEVAETAEQKSGGSMGMLIIALAGLSLARRKSK